MLQNYSQSDMSSLFLPCSFLHVIIGKKNDGSGHF